MNFVGKRKKDFKFLKQLDIGKRIGLWILVKVFNVKQVI